MPTPRKLTTASINGRAWALLVVLVLLAAACGDTATSPADPADAAEEPTATPSATEPAADPTPDEDVEDVEVTATEDVVPEPTGVTLGLADDPNRGIFDGGRLWSAEQVAPDGSGHRMRFEAEPVSAFEGLAAHDGSALRWLGCPVERENALATRVSVEVRSSSNGANDVGVVFSVDRSTVAVGPTGGSVKGIFIDETGRHRCVVLWDRDSGEAERWTNEWFEVWRGEEHVVEGYLIFEAGVGFGPDGEEVITHSQPILVIEPYLAEDVTEPQSVLPLLGSWTNATALDGAARSGLDLRELFVTDTDDA